MGVSIKVEDETYNSILEFKKKNKFLGKIPITQLISMAWKDFDETNKFINEEGDSNV